MLLALTRGFVKLYNNLNHELVHQDPSEDDVEDDPIRRRLFIFPKRRLHRPGTTEVQEKFLVGEKSKTEKAYNRSYIGSNSREIIIELNRFPMSLSLVGLIFLAAVLSFGTMYVISEENMEDPSDSFRAIGSIIELLGAMLALCLLLIKVMYRKWSFVDMLNSRKRCQSLSELIQVMKYTKKIRWFSWGENINDKIDAIRLCANIPNPATIFSYHNSCAFTDAGVGEFEIDEDIEMNHLNDANYIFGVNYYGDPIVKDVKGNIRKVHFRLCVNCKNEHKCLCPRKKIHIGSIHDLQTKSIYSLNFENRLVGTRRSYNVHQNP